MYYTDFHKILDIKAPDLQANQEKLITILAGGMSGEREISLLSSASINQALIELGYRVKLIDFRNDLNELLTQLSVQKPDVIFNALHGTYGEDGTVQGFLNILQIPYTHSSALASALGMNKVASKRIVNHAGVPCPRGMVISRQKFYAGDPLPRPYVIKPINQGSSLGVKIVFKDYDLLEVEQGWDYGDNILVEEYIPGREITVLVMGGVAIGTLEIKTKNQMFDYEAKYTPNKSEHIVPANLPPEIYGASLKMAEAAHNSLGCRSITRVDFRYNDTDIGPKGLYFLEINTQPGLTNISLVPDISKNFNISFNQLINWMVENAAYD